MVRNVIEFIVRLFMVRVKYIVICNTKELKALKVYFQEFLYERLLEFGIQEYIIENTPSYILLRFIEHNLMIRTSFIFELQFWISKFFVLMQDLCFIRNTQISNLFLYDASFFIHMVWKTTFVFFSGERGGRSISKAQSLILVWLTAENVHYITAVTFCIFDAFKWGRKLT